jgi:hypothetical protein
MPDSSPPSSGHDRQSSNAYPGTPRWVKVSVIVALILGLLVVVIMVASGGSHGPGRHLPSGDAGGRVLAMAHGTHRP